MAELIESKPKNALKQMETTIVQQDLVDSADPNPLGACSAEQIQSVLVDKLGNDPELDESELIIAATALAKAIYQRSINLEAVNDPAVPLIFVISERAKLIANEVGALPEPIIDDGSCTLAGRLWISGPPVKSAYGLPLQSTTPSQIFSQLSTLGLGSLPALFVQPASTVPEIRCYPRGIESPDYVIKVPVFFNDLKLEDLDEILQSWHSSFKTPDAGCGDHTPWQQPSKYVPRPETERFLQGWLKSTLRVALPVKFRIHAEVPGDEGRCDLMITAKHPTTMHSWIYYATMELKVLRSLDSGSNSVSKAVRDAAICKGTQQAISYKTENDAKYGLLCCFDMRKPDHCDGESCLNPVRQLAETYKVELRHYRVYGSADDLRREKYNLPSPEHQ